MAEELTSALGRDVAYRKITPEQHLAAMIDAGLPEEVASSNAQAFALIAPKVTQRGSPTTSVPSPASRPATCAPS